MEAIFHKLAEGLLLAAAMAWQVGWSLVLGFTLSGIIQAVVSKDQMRRQLGRDGIREMALATGYGAASSSCSYAAAALSKTLFKKGAALAPSLAFLFASTNLVVELGVLLFLLMGWQFTAAEWLGGLILIVVMGILVKLTYPTALVEAARAHVAPAGGHEHDSEVVEGGTLGERLRNPRTKIVVAQTVAMEWSMLRGDLIIGFLIAGLISAFVPQEVWKVLFFDGAAPWVQVTMGAVVGAIIAIVTFVCSIGNVPMAAVLWATGIPFAGVLSFLYADLIVLPLLDVYRKYYGWRMAAYMFAVFFSTMVLSAIVMAGVFAYFHAIPAERPDVRGMVEQFSFNYTFWLNLIGAIVILYLISTNRRNPMDHGCHGESPHHEPIAATTP